MKHLLLTLALILSSAFAGADNGYAPQLTQLASEISGYLVGTPDGTFKSCTYEDGQLVFYVNEISRFNQQFYAIDDFDQKDAFLDTTLMHIFSGESGISIVTFLEQTRTAILWKLPQPGGNGACSEKSVWPGELKEKLKQAKTQQ